MHSPELNCLALATSSTCPHKFFEQVVNVVMRRLQSSNFDNPNKKPLMNKFIQFQGHWQFTPLTGWAIGSVAAFSGIVVCFACQWVSTLAWLACSKGSDGASRCLDDKEYALPIQCKPPDCLFSTLLRRMLQCCTGCFRANPFGIPKQCMDGINPLPPQAR